MKKVFSTSQGFTLVEILVVISIVSILSSIAIASMAGARATSNDKVRVTDLAQIQLALKLYQTQNGSYPSYDAGTPVSGVAGLDTYGNIPTDPKANDTYGYVYDSDYDCTAAGQTVIYAQEMETATANEDSLCGGTGGTKYVVIIQ